MNFNILKKTNFVNSITTQSLLMTEFKGSLRITQVSESETLAMAKYVRLLKSQGKDIISFTLGEPDFPTPKHICESVYPFLEQGQIKYTPVAGILELREAVAEYFHKISQIPYKSENIIISTGAKQSIFNAVMALVNPGDEVIIPTPFWVSYAAMVHLAEGKPVFIPTTHEQNFKITPEQLEKAITPKSRLIIFSSPSNPTGSIYSQKELEALANVILKYPHLYVIADEIYQLINYEGSTFSLASISEIFDRTITINGVSKAFSMTGWRIGFLGAPKWIADLCEKYQGQVTSGANFIAQKAALTAITSDLTPTYEMVKIFKKRRDLGISLFKKLLPDIPLDTPPGAFYFFPNIHHYLNKQASDNKIIKNSEDLAFYLVDHGVATIPGSAFGADDYLRLSYACSENDIQEGIHRLAQALNLLK